MNNNPRALNGSAIQIKCAIYTRYASVPQVPTFTDAQEKNCRAAAEQLGWTVLDGFVRSDRGISGMKMDGRIGLNSLIEQAKNFPGTFDRVLVAEVSRLSRNFGDLLRVVEAFSQHGVSLYSVSQGLDSRDPEFRTLLASHTL